MRFWFVLDFCLWWQQRWCLQPRGARGCGGELSCFGGAWGYITDPSGMLQLGARFYWPEVGRFVQQDPIGEGSNWYAYVGNNPLIKTDPEGLQPLMERPPYSCTDTVSGPAGAAGCCAFLESVSHDKECTEECLASAAATGSTACVRRLDIYTQFLECLGAKGLHGIGRALGRALRGPKGFVSVKG